jgi:maltose O-acetyltransferase
MRLYRWGGVRYGSDTYINMNVHMIIDPARNAIVEMGERVAVAPGVVFAALSDPNKSRLLKYFPKTEETIVLEDDVWIGANATILPGVRIGRMSVVAAGCVVTRDVEPGHVVAGVPGKSISRITLD